MSALEKLASVRISKRCMISIPKQSFRWRFV